MTIKDILDELPDEARRALIQESIRQGKPISELIGNIAVEAAERILQHRGTPEPAAKHLEKEAVR